MHFNEALQYLQRLGHETLNIKLGLTTTERLLEALGRPQLAFPAVQIAGTNGKGSTAAMLDAICCAAEINSGLYTSPHLISFTERIRVGGQEAAPQLFADSVSAVCDAVSRVREAYGVTPTFFEQMTAMALVAFRAARVELGILETGLGGRLDATTAARAATIAITPIALDHQEYLGDTLAEISAEKAAIIRPGITSTAVIGPQHPEAERVITERCRECGVEPRFATRDARVIDASSDDRRLCIDFTTRRDYYRNVRLSLRGRHQVTNAAIAIELAESLREREGFPIPRDAIIEGLERAAHAGRLELRPGEPAILFDGAHNAAGALALRAYLDEFARGPVTLVFGAMRDKSLTAMLAALCPIAERLILTCPDNPRAADRETLERAVPLSFDSRKLSSAPTVIEALVRAREETAANGLICITGSLYLVGEALGVVNGKS